MYAIKVSFMVTIIGFVNILLIQFCLIIENEVSYGY